MSLLPQHTRDTGEFFERAKSYARRAEAEKRLANCADLLGPGETLDYLIWRTKDARHVPVWLMSAEQTTYALTAVSYGVVAFRR